MQAVSEDLRKRLLSRATPLPAASNDANARRFTDMTQHAIEAENDLKTITNVAEKAAHRQTRPCNIRQNTSSQRGPRTVKNDMNSEESSGCQEDTRKPRFQVFDDNELHGAGSERSRRGLHLRF
jgi:hypothetical protein